MAAEVINLRKARKARARSEAETRAAENRVRFGRSKAERAVLSAEDDLQSKRLEGHRLPGPSRTDTDEPA